MVCGEETESLRKINTVWCHLLMQNLWAAEE